MVSLRFTSKNNYKAIDSELKIMAVSLPDHGLRSPGQHYLTPRVRPFVCRSIRLCFITNCVSRSTNINHIASACKKR